jgi:hypothetical protein
VGRVEDIVIGDRRQLADLTLDQQKQFVDLAGRYVSNPNVMMEHDQWHTDHPDVPNAPGTSAQINWGLQFLKFHRDFLQEFESWLGEQPGGQQFVPLPIWNPDTPIPPGITHDPRAPAYDPVVIPDQFQPGVGAINSADELGRQIMGYHNLVHGAVGGDMANVKKAIMDPLFWAWHAFVDRVWGAWSEVTVTVPGMVACTVLQATSILQGFHLNLGATTEASEQPAMYGVWDHTVLRSSPPRGAAAAIWSRVDLVINIPID